MRIRSCGNVALLSFLIFHVCFGACSKRTPKSEELKEPSPTESPDPSLASASKNAQAGNDAKDKVAPPPTPSVPAPPSGPVLAPSNIAAPSQSIPISPAQSDSGGPPPVPTPVPAPGQIANLTLYHNPNGQASTVSAAGLIDLGNPFFQVLGTNGRSCASCHDPRAGWSITPPLLQHLFESSAGTHPIFSRNDGSNSPLANVATLEDRRQAYSLLLAKGLIRMGLPMPAHADFELVAIEDPYGFANIQELSLFRRPLPTTNLRSLNVVLWDGRESLVGQPLGDSLMSQANTANIGHGQGQALSQAQKEQIVAFQLALSSAQTVSNFAGPLYEFGANGGPLGLSRMAPPGVLNTPDAFTIFNGWAGDTSAARVQIARGEAIFNRRTFIVEGVSGFNDNDSNIRVRTSCSGCHNAANLGSNVVKAMMDLDLAADVLTTGDLPLYTLRDTRTGRTRRVSDPGRALVTGRWNDIGKFKVPTLRNLSARAPYFHNGHAGDLAAVVNFYNARFRIKFSPQERGELVAFLQSL